MRKVEPERAAVRTGEPRVKGEIIEAEQVDEPEAGRRQAQKMQSPVRPRAEEVAEHELSHLPYRSWCRFCVRGRCRALPHRAGVEQPVGSELHFDYCFLGKEGEPGKTLPVCCCSCASRRAVCFFRSCATLRKARWHSKRQQDGESSLFAWEACETINHAQPQTKNNIVGSEPTKTKNSCDVSILFKDR